MCGSLAGGTDQGGAEQTVLYMIQSGNRHGTARLLEPLANDSGGYVLTGPIFAGGVFYYSQRDGLVKAVQASSLRIIWLRQLAQSGALFILGIIKGALFLQGQDTIWALRISDGAMLWQQSIIWLGG